MAELLLHHGVVRTIEESRPRASAILCRDGRIVAVGDDSEVERLAGADARRVDLAGRVVLPGFNDAHVHVWKVGHLLTSMVDLRTATSLAEALAALRARLVALPADAPLLARGIDELRLLERRLPTASDLDAITSERPIVVTRACGHIAIVNSCVLTRAGIDRDRVAPPGGLIDRDERGEPTGVLRETAVALAQAVLPRPTRSEYEAMIQAAHRALLEVGVTSATDPGVDPDLIEAYRALESSERLAVRMNVMRLGATTIGPSAVPELQVSERLRLDSVKFFVDGALSGGTAALNFGYSDGRTGILRLDEPTFYELAKPLHRAGLRIGVHAIGDRAIECALGVFDCLRLDGPGLRHRIEHCGFPTETHLKRIERARYSIVAQAIFLAELGMNFRARLPAKAPTPYPLRAMLDAQCDLALSSDAPVVTDLRPLANIAAAVARRDREGVVLDANQSISVNEALRAMTLGGAIASGDDHDRGSLRPGKFADLVVLERDPCDVPVEEIATVRVLATLSGGDVVAGAL